MIMFALACSLILAGACGSAPGPPKPVAFKGEVPTRGVSIAGNLLIEPVMRANIDYLLRSFDVDHILYAFRQRAGKEAPPGNRPQIRFWDTDLRGSNAGRFLMGAGNTLRWIENVQLRRMMNKIVDGIEECRNTSNGYILAFEPDGFMHSEQGDYARSWFTQGLIEAGKCGNNKVWALLRGQYDWFNDAEQNPFLPYIYDGISNGEQGQIASTRVYLETPIGVYRDSQVAQDTYRDNFWMRQLIARDPLGISDYHMPAPHRAHCYEITSFLSMFDNYRATHNSTWLEAAKGAWELLKGNYVHIDGSSALKEGSPNHPPKSYLLSPSAHTGETCCTTFWIKFNQRFHLLTPDEEQYVAQMETAIYNALLRQMVNSVDVKPLPLGIRYHAPLQGEVEAPQNVNTCCEGQGTRAFGSLPEYIYTHASDGLYVNLFTASSVEFNVSLSSHTRSLRESLVQPSLLNEGQPSLLNAAPAHAPPLSWKQLETDGWHPGAFCEGSVRKGGAPAPCPKDVPTLEECKRLCLVSEQPYVCMGVTWVSNERRCTLYTAIDLTAKVNVAPGVQQWLVVGRRVPVEIDYEPTSESAADDGFRANDAERVSVRLVMDTVFPNKGAVSMQMSWSDTKVSQIVTTLRLRIPSWLPDPMAVTINGQAHATGIPGTYLTINRTWLGGDKIAFNLPTVYKFTQYTGAEQVPGYEGKRYALIVGPIVLACVGPMSTNLTTLLPVPPGKPDEWLIPTQTPLNFAVKGAPAFRFKPLYSVKSGESFTTYPIFTGQELTEIHI